jgi:Bacterial membrane protein YfhO
VFRVLYSVVPGLKNFRAPSLATFVAVAALTLLAALLLERTLARDDLASRRVLTRGLAIGGLAALLIALVALASGHGFYSAWTSVFGAAEGGRPAAFDADLPKIAMGGLVVALICAAAWASVYYWGQGKLRPIHVIAVLIGLTVLDLVRVDDRYIQIVRYDDFFPPDPGIEALRARLVPGERVLTIGGVYPEGFLATYGIPEVFGYHGNQLRWYNALTRYDVRQSAGTTGDLEQYWLSLLASAALKTLSARYILLPGQVDIPGLRLLGADQRVAIYANDAAMPGVAVVPNVQVEPDSARRIATLWSPTFDPSKTVLTEEPVQSIGQAGGTGSATIEGNGDDTLAVRVRSSGPALLTVSRTYHPSWQAEIDGVPAAVIRVNQALIGVPLTRAGEHRVMLRYRPQIVRVAAIATAATWVSVLFLTLVGAALARRQRRG